MTYQEIKHEEGERVGELSTRVGLFWAFSNEQFEKNKTPLQEGDKYVSIGAGGFVPRSQVDTFIQGMKDIETWKKEEVKKNKAEQERTILYELNNYECFYTGDIEPALEVLKPLGFTRKQVQTVYRANVNKMEA